MNASYFPQLKHKKNNVQSIQSSLSNISVLNKRNYKIQELLQNQLSRTKDFKQVKSPQQSPKVLGESNEDQKIFHYYSRMKLVGKKFTQQNKILDYQTDTTSRNDDMSGSRNTFSPYHQENTKLTENTSKSMASTLNQRSRRGTDFSEEKTSQQKIVIKQFKFLLPGPQQKSSTMSPMREYLLLDGKKGNTLGSSSTLQFASHLMEKIANNLKQTSDSCHQVTEENNQFKLKTSNLVTQQIAQLTVLNTQQKILLKKSTSKLPPHVGSNIKIQHKPVIHLQRYAKTSNIRKFSPSSPAIIDSIDYGNAGDIRGWETYVLEDNDGEQLFNALIK